MLSPSADQLKATCVDVQHKKRGRPRLREEPNTHEVDFGFEYSDRDHYSNGNGAASIPQLNSRRSKSFRELRSQPDQPFDESRPRPADQAHPLHQLSQGANRLPTSQSPAHLSQSTPTAFLTPDFRVAEHNLAFADALGLNYSASGLSLTDLVISSEGGKIQRLQTALRAELTDLSRTGRLHGSYENANGMPTIENLDLGQATAGFRPRSEYWTFRLPKGRSIGFPITLSLARNGGQFIVLTLVQSSNVAMQASPHASQVVEGRQSAPTSSSQGLRSPPLGGRSDQHHHRHRNDHSQSNYVHPMELSTSHITGAECRPLSVQASPNASLDQYSHQTPLQATVLPYSLARPSSSSESPRNSPALHHEIPGKNLRHLQLPPIRTSGNGISEPSRPSDERRGGQSHDKLSPAKGSPQSGRKKKRQRVEIVDMLH